jgi:hypothetical protein
MTIHKTKFLFIYLFILLIFFETLSTFIIHYRYKKFNTQFDELGILSTYFIFKKVSSKIFNNKDNYERVVANPSPFLIFNEVQGYSNNPGTYTITFKRNIENKINSYVSNVTINSDGSRYIGMPRVSPKANIYIYGDSFIFGWGLNDEQTFAYLLQQKFRDLNFHLIAAPGWSLSNALINIEENGKDIKKNDLIILGYGDYYKERHVASPSRMRAFGEPSPSMAVNVKHIKYSLNSSGELVREYIPVFCKFNISYCKSKDMTTNEIDEITKKIINSISNKTEATIVLLHFEGDNFDPVLKELDPRIKVILATDKSFTYKIRDNIMGLDDHPGPFWNYAIYTRMSDFIREKYK